MIDNAIVHLKEVDNRLKTIITNINLPMIKLTGDVFEDMVSCILDMQIHYRGKATRYHKLKLLLNNTQITSNTIFSIADEGLKELKISNQKYKALMSLCEYWEEYSLGNKNWHMTNDDEVREILLNIRGIGNWTVDMILLFTLQRKNIFPVDDFNLKKIMKYVYDIEDNSNIKKEMIEVAKIWEPHASLAVLFLLEYSRAKNSFL